MDIFAEKISELISQTINLDKNEVYKMIEVPPEDKFGDYSFPCFTLSSKLRKNPIDIAQEIKNKINPTIFPIIVDLRWPIPKGLAIFGDDISITTVLFLPILECPNFGFFILFITVLATKSLSK